MKLERLAYVSHAAEPADSLMAVSDILEQSVRNNRGNNITGALAFTTNRFAQVLEGSPGSLDVLMLKLALDPRHYDMVVLDRIPIQHRLFSDWAMIAPVFTPDGATRLAELVAGDNLSLAELTDLVFEMVGEQRTAAAARNRPVPAEPDPA